MVFVAIVECKLWLVLKWLMFMSFLWDECVDNCVRNEDKITVSKYFIFESSSSVGNRWFPDSSFNCICKFYAALAVSREP